jgi:hypothetical protein
MYSDKKRSIVPVVLTVLLIICLICGILALRVFPGSAITEESAAAIREAVERSARQCYVVEGVYPPTLEYLQENYGLQVNTRDFYITYTAFASNLPPTVRVTMR